MHVVVGIAVVIILQSVMALGFSMDPQSLNQSVRKYLSIYNNYQIDENIDEDVVDDFIEFIQQNADVYNYIAVAETDPEFLPYLQKYSDLKLHYTGRPMDSDIKVLFSATPTNSNRLKGDTSIADDFTRVIFMDRNFWNYHRDNQKVRETLLFHELGHVDLYREDILIWSDKKHFYSFMSIRLLAFIVLPEPIDLNRTFYRDSPKKIAEIRGLRAALDSLFQILYEELFSEENTKDYRSCYPRSISYDCSITQREAFMSYTRALHRIKLMTIGPEL